MKKKKETLANQFNHIYKTLDIFRNDQLSYMFINTHIYIYNFLAYIKNNLTLNILSQGSFLFRQINTHNYFSFLISKCHSY